MCSMSPLWAFRTEFQPGQKAIAVDSITDIPAIIDRVIEAANSGYFDAQMKQISDNLASKIKGGRGNDAAQVQQAAWTIRLTNGGDCESAPYFISNQRYVDNSKTETANSSTCHEETI